MTEQPKTIEDVILDIMCHTGWTRGMAEAAIRAWRDSFPDWTPEYALYYMQPVAESERAGGIDDSSLEMEVRRKRSFLLLQKRRSIQMVDDRHLAWNVWFTFALVFVVVQAAFLALRLSNIVEWRWAVVLIPLWIYLALPPSLLGWFILKRGEE